MPELPEVETVCRTLHPLIVGCRIDSFETYWPRTVDPHSPGDIARALRGRTIDDVSRRGKYIVLSLDNSNRLAIHLRMTGELLFSRVGGSQDGREREPYLRARVRFEGGDELLFYDVRKFGRIRIHTLDSWNALDNSLGIEPLSDVFTPEALHSLLNSRRRQIKPLLLDQTVIAGLGNIYVDESLFRAQIHPLARSDSLSFDDASRLRDAIVHVLSGAIANRGTTFRDYRTGTGEAGENRLALLVYGSPEGTPCPRCGTPLRRLVIGQRGTVYCPQCQPEPARDQAG